MRRWARAGLAALAAAALLSPATTGWARTAPPRPANATSALSIPVSQLRAELRAGTLGAGRGVVDICATHHLRCAAQAVTVAGNSSRLLETSTPVGYGATDLQRAYGLAKAPAGGGTIAIIDAGAYPTLESDLAVYRSAYGLPRCTSATGCFRQVKYTGGRPYAPATDPDVSYLEELVALETALDVDMASAACPRCTILEVQLPVLDASPDDQAAEDVAAKHFATATSTAVRLGAKAVSISYTYDADSYTDLGPPARGMAHRGVAVVASSGDAGVNLQGNKWPADLTTVIAAGGTSLYQDATARRGFTEVAWNSSGSGCTGDLGPANHQPDAISSACGGSRADTDLSAVADPYTGVAVYSSYAPATDDAPGWVVLGGTSVAAPFIAGMYLRAGVRSGVLGPNELYQAPAAAYNDVVIGVSTFPGVCAGAGLDDRICAAGPGWDGPTGLGTPRGLTPFLSRG